MPKLYHSPQSRSSNIISLLRLMGKETEVDIEIVHIKRQRDLGHQDPRNPHPDGKVPVLETQGRLVRESGAIMLWLTDHFDSALGRGVGDPARAEYLSWLFYYGSVMEPILYLSAFEIAQDKMITEWCRDQDTMLRTLEQGLSGSDFLLGDTFSAVDLLLSSPFQWVPGVLPDQGVLRAWSDRCLAAQDTAFVTSFDADAMAQLGLTAHPG